MLYDHAITIDKEVRHLCSWCGPNYTPNRQIEWIWTFVIHIPPLRLCPNPISKAPKGTAKNDFYFQSLCCHFIAFVRHVQYFSHRYNNNAGISGWAAFVSATLGRYPKLPDNHSSGILFPSADIGGYGTYHTNCHVWLTKMSFGSSCTSYYLYITLHGRI